MNEYNHADKIIFFISLLKGSEYIPDKYCIKCEYHENKYSYLHYYYVVVPWYWKYLFKKERAKSNEVSSNHFCDPPNE